MKKVQVVRLYVSENIDWISDMLKNGDQVALREDWGCFTDGLCKDGEISEKQYMNWIVPNFRNWVRRLRKEDK